MFAVSRLMICSEMMTVSAKAQAVRILPESQSSGTGDSRARLRTKLKRFHRVLSLTRHFRERGNLDLSCRISLITRWCRGRNQLATRTLGDRRGDKYLAGAALQQSV